MRAAELIVKQCDADPPDHVDPHPHLFSDLEDKSHHDALFKLWRKGVVDAEWNEEAGESEWWLTEFGVELHRRGLNALYIRALEEDIQIDASPGTLVDPQEAMPR